MREQQIQGQAIENGYYVQAPLKLLAETIQARVALRLTSSHLLIGGLGSGKTTQLLFAAQNLKQIEDIHPIYDDFMIHSPPMSPLEILRMFLYDLYFPTRPRAS